MPLGRQEGRQTEEAAAQSQRGQQVEGGEDPRQGLTHIEGADDVLIAR